MCGRIVRDRESDFQRFGFYEESDTHIVPRFNIAPTQMDLFIRAEDDSRRLVASRWGLIPVWAKDRSAGSKMFNARAETLLERHAFRTLVRGHRCIIPVSGFYEWQSRPGAKQKQPLYIHAADGEPLALAGLWTRWHDPAHDEDVTSHTIITCGPNDMMAAIHNRMPAILDEAGVDLWLDPAVRDPEAVLPLLVPCADDVLTAYPVAPLVNRVGNDGPDLIAPLTAA